MNLLITLLENEYTPQTDQPEVKQFLYVLIPLAVIALFIIYKIVKKRKIEDYDE